jgi:integrase
MILLYDSVIRLEELLALKLSDLNIQDTNLYIRIHGKEDKERIVAITGKTVGHLQLYMRYHRTFYENRDHVLSTGREQYESNFSSIERSSECSAKVCLKSCILGYIPVGRTGFSTCNISFLNVLRLVMEK